MALDDIYLQQIAQARSMPFQYNERRPVFSGINTIDVKGSPFESIGKAIGGYVSEAYIKPRLQDYVDEWEMNNNPKEIANQMKTAYSIWQKLPESARNELSSNPGYQQKMQWYKQKLGNYADSFMMTSPEGKHEFLYGIPPLEQRQSEVFPETHDLAMKKGRQDLEKGEADIEFRRGPETDYYRSGAEAHSAQAGASRTQQAVDEYTLGFNKRTEGQRISSLQADTDYKRAQAWRSRHYFPYSDTMGKQFYALEKMRRDKAISNYNSLTQKIQPNPQQFKVDPDNTVKEHAIAQFDVSSQLASELPPTDSQGTMASNRALDIAVSTVTTARSKGLSKDKAKTKDWQGKPAYYMSDTATKITRDVYNKAASYVQQHKDTLDWSSMKKFCYLQLISDWNLMYDNYGRYKMTDDKGKPFLRLKGWQDVPDHYVEKTFQVRKADQEVFDKERVRMSEAPGTGSSWGQAFSFSNSYQNPAGAEE